MHLKQHHRHDYFNLEVIYFTALLLLLFLITISFSEIGSRFGFINAKDVKKSDITFEFIGATPESEAKSYIVYDIVDKKILYARNENEILPLASITKLMTAIAALELKDGSTLITINKFFIEDGFDIGLKDGQLWKLSELAKYMLVFSSNDAANVIAGTVTNRSKFIEKMNEIATREGMTSLRFTNPSGIDDPITYGGVGSALDVAKLMAYAYKKIPEIIDATTKSRATLRTSEGPLSGVPNTNQEVEKYVGLEGSKTGFTDEAGGNLTVVFDVALGRPIVIVVLGSSRANRFSDVEKLYDITKNSLK